MTTINGMVLVSLFGAVIAAATISGASEHMGHTMTEDGAQADAPAAGSAYSEAQNRMNHDMAMTPTGDADIDFARAMIPHHEGAIEMARIVLETGSDPELQRLAREIVAAQEAEIAFLQSWLAANGE